jgi:LEA14-like dessication related protein
MMRGFAVALPLLPLLACATAEVKPDAPAPTLEGQDLQVISQSLTEFHLKLLGKLKCADACTATKAKYELVVDGKVVSSGEQNLNQGAGDFALDQTSKYVSSAEDLKAMDARGGSLLVALRGTIQVTQGGKPFTVDFAHSHEVRVPRLPHVKFQELEAGRFSEDEAAITFHIGVNNPNPFELRVDEIKYEVTVAGKKVADGTIGRGEKVSPASTGVFDIEVKVDADTHGAAEIKKLIKGKVLPYEITGSMAAELHNETFDFKGDIKLNAPK